MRSTHERRKRAGILVVAALAILAVVAPVSASAVDPVDCPPGARAIVLRAENVELVALTKVVHTVAVREAAHAVALVDLEVDRLDFEAWEHGFRPFDRRDDGPAAMAAYPVSVGIDLLIGAAKLPGRAALTVRHLVEAFARVAPQVVSSIF